MAGDSAPIQGPEHQEAASHSYPEGRMLGGRISPFMLPARGGLPGSSGGWKVLQDVQSDLSERALQGRSGYHSDETVARGQFG
jgi:hypothetical protein